ncbi:MAG: hypothetical protein WBW74_18510 [Xanthobacteraceae bacterium]
MKHGKCIIPLLLLICSMSACSPSETKLDPIAGQLRDAVNRCVLDVRDRRVKYEDSSNCRSMGRIAQQYVDAGGFTQSAPCHADRVAENARARAWMALAISKAGDPNLTIW